jgi:hypothetical protein
MARTAEPAAPTIVKNLNVKTLLPLSQGELEKLIKGYLLMENVSDSRFGRDAMSDPNFITRLNADRPKLGGKTRLRLTQFFIDKGYAKHG